MNDRTIEKLKDAVLFLLDGVKTYECACGKGESCGACEWAAEVQAVKDSVKEA
jgi:hypothetical protein